MIHNHCDIRSLGCGVSRGTTGSTSNVAGSRPTSGFGSIASKRAPAASSGGNCFLERRTYYATRENVDFNKIGLNLDARSTPVSPLTSPPIGQQVPADSRRFAASFARIRKGCQLVPHREDQGLEHPALLPSHLDLAPWNKQWRVHEPKKEHAGQIQTLGTGSNRQHVVVVRQPPHLSALHSPFRPIERCPFGKPA